MAHNSTLHLIRASHANEFELQNYAPLMGKHDIQVITSRHPLTDITLSVNKLWSPTDLLNFPYRRQLLNRLIGGEQWLFGLRKYCYHVSKHSNKADMVLHTAETYSPYTHQAVQLKKEGLISKLICTCWETIPHNNEKFARLRKWKHEAYEQVDIFHTPTQRAKDALIVEGVEESKIHVIPYGVDLTRFRPKKRKRNLRPIVLTVARLEKEKGMAELEKIASSLPQYDFRVVGQGSYRFTTPNISISQVPYSEIHTAYQDADLFLFPSQRTESWEEQYGMALVEAMACGLPIVTTDSGAIPEVVGWSGVVLPESDFASSAARSIQKIITDTALRSRLSKTALTRAHKLYDRLLVAKKLATIYADSDV
jgi:alpha-maltose-1-phosphate synthase